MPGKRVTIVRVFYGPGGFTRPHHHAGSVTATITKGEIRSQLGGGPVEVFKVGQAFFEPPGATHMISANASSTEPAELIAVFVADEGAQLRRFWIEGAAVGKAIPQRYLNARTMSVPTFASSQADEGGHGASAPCPPYDLTPASPSPAIRRAASESATSASPAL